MIFLFDSIPPFSSQSYLFILKKYPPSFNQVNIFPGPSSAHGLPVQTT